MAKPVYFVLGHPEPGEPGVSPHRRESIDRDTPGLLGRLPASAPAAAVLIGIGILAAGGAMATEELPYRTIKREGQFELRRIEAHLVAETIVEGDFEEVGDQGFRVSSNTSVAPIGRRPRSR